MADRYKLIIEFPSSIFHWLPGSVTFNRMDECQKLCVDGRGDTELLSGTNNRTAYGIDPVRAPRSMSCNIDERLVPVATAT